MGITQAYRLGKNPDKVTDPCPPAIVIFNTTDMAESILYAARGEGQSRNFKENIPEVYSTQYNEFIRVGVYLKENQGLNYRLRFEEHTLQLQVRKPMADQYHVIKIHEPKQAINTLAEISEVDLSCVMKPSEEDTRKLTIILGTVKINMEAKPVQVPDEILEEMNKDEEKAIRDRPKWL